MTSWIEIGSLLTDDEYVQFRHDKFCCSVVYTKRIQACSVCPGGHEMSERRLRCKSQTCDARTDGEHSCPVRWKVRQCDSTSRWVVLTNGAAHNRGIQPCAIAPRAVITPEMRQYILREEGNEVAPRNIWSSLLRAPDVPAPLLGFPTYAQVQRCVKYIRWQHGYKNSILHVQEQVREAAFTDDLDAASGFVFEYRDDDEGFPHVGNGQDSDPLILGITSMAVMRGIQAMQAREPFLLFHMDATFKLSDIGYPVITCGFTDRTRTYHLAAVFIVSRRTANEYRLAIGSFIRLFETKMRCRLRVDGVMGDAEDAQLNALNGLAAFDGSRYLMCFFHVLYNARKRIRHLPEAVRVVVLKGILDMHYATSEAQLWSEWDRVLRLWKQDSRLDTFVDYFYKQWMTGRFWRWQIFHTPSGFATTNNPCEVFNASIKRYTLRKALDIGRLIKKLVIITEDTTLCTPPVSVTAAAPLPPQEAKQLAKVLVSTNRVAVYSTEDSARVLVHYLGDQSAEEPGDLPAAMRTKRRAAVVLANASLSDAEKKSAAAFYRASVKWAVRRAHHDGTPQRGWSVNVETSTCGCKYFAKFGVCAHVICARVFVGKSVPGVNAKYLKFKDRRIRHPRVPQPGTTTDTDTFGARNTEGQSSEIAQQPVHAARPPTGYVNTALHEDVFDGLGEQELEISVDLQQSLLDLLDGQYGVESFQSPHLHQQQYRLPNQLQHQHNQTDADELLQPDQLQPELTQQVLLNPRAAQGRPARAASALSIQFLLS